MALPLAEPANLLEEELILLSRAGNTLPGRIHCSTPPRWAYHGVRKIHLEHIHIGGRVYTSRQALARFFARVTESRIGRREEPSPPAPRNQVGQAAASERAEAIFGGKTPANDPPRGRVRGKDRPSTHGRKK